MDRTPTRRRRLLASASIVLVGAIGLGGIAHAAGEPTPQPTPRERFLQLTPEERCAKAETALAKLDQAQERLAAVESRLTTLRGRAVELGADDLVTFIDEQLARVATIQQHVAERATRLPEWFAANCPS